MTNTVPLKKQNKRAQKEYHSKKRGSWYGISPVTRSVPNGRAYEMCIRDSLRSAVIDRFDLLAAFTRDLDKQGGHHRRIADEGAGGRNADAVHAVSYTHLDVYKRQAVDNGEYDDKTDAVVSLDADLDLTGVAWKPIGSVFDGEGNLLHYFGGKDVYKRQMPESGRSRKKPG